VSRLRVRSIGWRTELALRELEGSEIEQQAECIVVRTEESPTFRWGNFILMASPPRRGEARAWMEKFASAFPNAEHVAIGLDSPSGERGAIEELTAMGLDLELAVVLTAGALRAPRRARPPATFRQLAGERDWLAAMNLGLANDPEGDSLPEIEPTGPPTPVTPAPLDNHAHISRGIRRRRRVRRTPLAYGRR
jgi:hypothetical protein